MVAHSLGAVATVIAIRRNWISPAQLAFVSPVRQVRDQLDRFARALAVGPRARRHLDAEVSRHCGIGPDDFAYDGTDPVLRHIPLLAVHDRQDRFVPYSETAALVTSWPGARLITTDRLGHVRILAEPGVAQDIATWASTPTSPSSPA